MGEQAFERLVEVGEVIVHLELAAAVLDRGQVIAHRFTVGFADHCRVGDEIRAAFHVHETHGTRKVEVVFLPIKQMEEVTAYRRLHEDSLSRSAGAQYANLVHSLRKKTGDTK